MSFSSIFFIWILDQVSGWFIYDLLTCFVVVENELVVSIFEIVGNEKSITISFHSMSCKLFTSTKARALLSDSVIPRIHVVAVLLPLSCLLEVGQSLL